MQRVVNSLVQKVTEEKEVNEDSKVQQDKEVHLHLPHPVDKSSNNHHSV
jgi:hypothetical protein